MRLKPKEIELYLDFAERVSQLSYCNRAKVGAVLVKKNNVISYGYNGTAPGEPNICEDEVTGKTLPNVIHAEDNAIRKCYEEGIDPCFSSIFVTIPPCTRCAEILVAEGVIEVYYRDYHLSQSNGTPDVLWYQERGVDLYKIERNQNDSRVYHPKQPSGSKEDCGCGC